MNNRAGTHRTYRASSLTPLMGRQNIQNLQLIKYHGLYRVTVPGPSFQYGSVSLNNKLPKKTYTIHISHTHTHTISFQHSSDDDETSRTTKESTVDDCVTACKYFVRVFRKRQVNQKQFASYAHHTVCVKF